MLAGEGCEEAWDDERGDEAKGDEGVVHVAGSPMAALIAYVSLIGGLRTFSSHRYCAGSALPS